VAKIIIGFNAAVDSPVNSLIEAAAGQWEALNTQCDRIISGFNGRFFRSYRELGR